MKEYFKYFKWLYIILGVLLLIFGFVKGTRYFASEISYYERTNTQCLTTQRVFDYADVLSDEEEKKLADLIDKREKQTNCDIVLVTLKQSLKEYAREIDPSVKYSEFVRIYAEQFYEENNFGYDKPNGDGVILVDNWFREDDGRIYTWFCTTGIVKDKYSDADINHILDRVYLYVENDPYKAYTTYVNEFYRDMNGSGIFYVDVPSGLPIITGVIVAIIFIAVNWTSRSGKKTTTAVTYVKGKNANFLNRQDIFIRKTVTHHRIQSSNGSGGGHSGGGGGHGGGGSHGGGGHSR